MHHSIGRLARWMRTAFGPRTPGRPSRVSLVRPRSVPPRTVLVPLRAPDMLDGDRAAAMVRPYVLAAEAKREAARQRSRRALLVCAIRHGGGFLMTPITHVQTKSVGRVLADPGGPDPESGQDPEDSARESVMEPGRLGDRRPEFEELSRRVAEANHRSIEYGGLR